MITNLCLIDGVTGMRVVLLFVNLASCAFPHNQAGAFSHVNSHLTLQPPHPHPFLRFRELPRAEKNSVWSTATGGRVMSVIAFCYRKGVGK